MATRFADHLLDGDHASRPAANTVPTGSLYACSDHGLIYQSDGSAWATWATLGGSVSADEVGFTPAGTIAATDVQAAIEEVASEAGGGGGMTRTYYGKNAIGASWEAMTANRNYLKAITPGAGVLASISAYVRGNSDAAGANDNLAFVVFDDNAGNPDHLLASPRSFEERTYLVDSVPGDGRWFTQAINMETAAATVYYVGVIIGAAVVDLAYDTGGSDRYFASSGIWAQDRAAFALTNSTRDYSIRALVLT